MSDEQSLVDKAAELIELVRSMAPGAQAEATVDATELSLTRFANSFIHQNVADASTTVRLRLHVDGRTATGGSSIVDTLGLRALVERTLAAARLAPLDPQWPGLAPPAAVPTVPAVDEQTAYAEPDARAARVRDFVAATDGLEAAGYCSTLRWARAFANSLGQSAASVSALASMDAIARQAGGDRKFDGVARLSSARLSDLDGARLGARAAAKARAQEGATELPPGRYEVVLEPTAVFDLLDNLAMFGFNGKAVHEGRSFVEVGEAQFDPSVTIVDDPLDPRGLAATFDVEGTPKSRRTFVDAGVSAAVAHDRRSAALAGTVSTGHAMTGGASWGAVPLNLHLLPAGDNAGTATSLAGDDHPAAGAGEVDGPVADASVAALVAGVERGLLVSDFWYTRVLDPRTLVITGLTRNGVWLIENGVVTLPVQNFRFTQSYPQALAAGAVLGVGTHAIGLPSGWQALCYRAPALRLASWNFTGNPSG
jgi:predicted Zn-dependent protease